MKRTFAVLALGLIASFPGIASAQDAAAGEKVFNQCKACHTIEAGGPNRVGPNLHGVVGRKSGSHEGFNYSDAMKNAGITWDEAQLDKYLTDPKGAVPGNKMAFAGVKNEQARKDLIAFLKGNS
ncbi:c-type cytochrome [Azospirillum canadense]|uniref:c-type cytochrome n=1 Tax=Azospirillum canadense TaxID=403962 RepID=UPI002225E794|nr:cytochrome c family protein [Azospirillum canadense]MCW2238424.1 cytochrome c [Azospirillum canadense]